MKARHQRFLLISLAVAALAAAGMFDSNYKHLTGPEWAQERHPWVDSRMSVMAAELFQRCAPR